MGLITASLSCSNAGYRKSMFFLCPLLFPPFAPELWEVGQKAAFKCIQRSLCNSASIFCIFTDSACPMLHLFPPSQLAAPQCEIRRKEEWNGQRRFFTWARSCGTLEVSAKVVVLNLADLMHYKYSDWIENVAPQSLSISEEFVEYSLFSLSLILYSGIHQMAPGYFSEVTIFCNKSNQ